MNRFAYVCADPGIPLPGKKGASIHVDCVVRTLLELGFEGEVFTVRPEAQTLGGVPLHTLNVPPKRKRKSMEERESRLFLGGIESSLVMQQHETVPPDFIYERYSMWHTGGLARARQLGIPFILEVNSPLPSEAKSFRGLANEPLAVGIARLLMREADGIVCVSEEIAQWVAGFREHREGVWVIPNGVDHVAFAPQPESRPQPLPPRNTPLVAFCGTFRPWHGTDDMLKAFHQVRRTTHPDAHLVCVGDGPQRESFELQVQRLGLENAVYVTGQVPHNEVARWIGGADVAVAPYPDLEEFYFSPLKIFEFLALGLPVVTTNVGQNSQLVPHGERGLLYRAGDVEGCAGAISTLLSQREEAKTMASAGQDWVLGHATWRHRVMEILELTRALHGVDADSLVPRLPAPDHRSDGTRPFPGRLAAGSLRDVTPPARRDMS